jgi:diguanylate cyclase (GGDEF)-like protein/PAS domain S-box-containing protein
MNIRTSGKGVQDTLWYLFVALTMLVLCTYLLAAKFLWDNTVQETHSTLSYINRILSQNTLTTLKSHELMLRALGEELLFLGAGHDPERGRRLIDQMLKTDPGMAGFGLVRADGQIILISGIPAGTPLPNLAEQSESREGFLEVLKSHELQTGRAYYMKTLKQWQIPIRVAIYDKTGKISFVMAAGYKIEGGTTTWADQALPDDVSIIVMRNDGYAQYVYPIPEGMSFDDIYSKTWPETDGVYKLWQASPSGYADIDLPARGGSHMAAYERLKNDELLTLTIMPMTSVWKQWLSALALPTTWFIAYLFISYVLFRYTRNKQLKSQSDLQQISAFQQAILNGANYCIITTTTDGIITSFNKAAEQMLGYPAEDMIGKKSILLFYSGTEIAQRASELSLDGGKKIQPGFETFIHPIKGGGSDEREWTNVRKDGTRFPSLVSVTAIQGEKENTTGYLMISSDISVRKKAELSLAENEAKYRTLFENSGDCIFLFSEEKFIDCNPATLSMFECRRDEIIGQPPYHFSPEYQPDGKLSRDKSLQYIRAAFAGERQSFEWQHTRCDGTPFDAEVTLNVIHLGDEDLILATVRDVSGRKLNEEKLKQYQQELLERNEKLRLTNELATRLQGLDDADSIVENTINILSTELNAPVIALYLIDHQNNNLKLAAQNGFSEGCADSGMTLPLENNPNSMALKEKRVITLGKVTQEETIGTTIRGNLINEGFECAAILPLVYGNEQLGTINLVYKVPVNFDGIFIETMSAISNTVSLALINARHLTDLRKQATHDILTGLANRNLLHQQFKLYLDNSKLSTDRPSLMLIDLDRFKEINDTLGHQTGDLLLKQIGPRLQELTGDNSLVCRLGGDEFAVLTNGTVEDAVNMASQLQDAIRRPFHINDMTLEIDSSLGIAHYPEHGKSSHDLLRSADVAMYGAKQSKQGSMVYDENLDYNTPERLALISELNRATKEDQLVLHYQPKLDLGESEIIAFEALVRWQHPDRGLLFPDSFIPMAELSEVIHPMTERIISSAVSQIQEWSKQGFSHRVAINLSSRNLIDDRCMLFLKDILARTKIDPACLEIEITETMLMQDPEKSAIILNRISALGIQISVDDYGTGYSSLAYLHRLPINTLKIDRTFVQDMGKNKHDFMIVRSTIELAHNLGLKVVAEGVEDKETLDMLQDMGCDQAQGYYISRPQPPQHFTLDVMDTINNICPPPGN